MIDKKVKYLISIYFGEMNYNNVFIGVHIALKENECMTNSQIIKAKSWI